MTQGETRFGIVVVERYCALEFRLRFAQRLRPRTADFGERAREQVAVITRAPVSQRLRKACARQLEIDARGQLGPRA